MDEEINLGEPLEQSNPTNAEVDPSELTLSQSLKGVVHNVRKHILKLAIPGLVFTGGSLWLGKQAIDAGKDTVVTYSIEQGLSIPKEKLDQFFQLTEEVKLGLIRLNAQNLNFLNKAKDLLLSDTVNTMKGLFSSGLKGFRNDLIEFNQKSDHSPDEIFAELGSFVEQHPKLGPEWKKLTNQWASVNNKILELNKLALSNGWDVEERGLAATFMSEFAEEITEELSLTSDPKPESQAPEDPF